MFLLLSSLEDGYVVVNLGFLPLCDTLSDPDNVAALLFLQFDVGVKYSEVELLQESKCVQFHLRKDKGSETERQVKKYSSHMNQVYNLSKPVL